MRLEDRVPSRQARIAVARDRRSSSFVVIARLHGMGGYVLCYCFADGASGQAGGPPVNPAEDSRFVNFGEDVRIGRVMTCSGPHVGCDRDVHAWVVAEHLSEDEAGRTAQRRVAGWKLWM